MRRLKDRGLGCFISTFKSFDGNKTIVRPQMSKSMGYEVVRTGNLTLWRLLSISISSEAAKNTKDTTTTVKDHIAYSTDTQPLWR